MKSYESIISEKAASAEVDASSHEMLASNHTISVPNLNGLKSRMNMDTLNLDSSLKTFEVDR